MKNVRQLCSAFTFHWLSAPLYNLWNNRCIYVPPRDCVPFKRFIQLIGVLSAARPSVTNKWTNSKNLSHLNEYIFSSLLFFSSISFQQSRIVVQFKYWNFHIENQRGNRCILMFVRIVLFYSSKHLLKMFQFGFRSLWPSVIKFMFTFAFAFAFEIQSG